MKDLKVTVDGELVIGSNGDFETVEGDEYIAQTALFLIKTTLGDFPLDPSFGVDLEQFIGYPNSSLVRTMIATEVKQALESRRFFPSPQVDCVALEEPNEVLLLVEFTSTEKPGRYIQIVSTLDLRKGVVFSRTGFR